MSQAHRGRALEHEVIHAFQAAGFVTIRGAGSKGSVDRPCEHCGKPMKVDFIATKATTKTTKEAWLVLGQCKLGKGTHGTRHRLATTRRTMRQDSQGIATSPVLES